MSSNDYNAFLTSFYDPDKVDAADKYPMDFAFGIEPTSNEDDRSHNSLTNTPRDLELEGDLPSQVNRELRIQTGQETDELSNLSEPGFGSNNYMKKSTSLGRFDDFNDFNDLNDYNTTNDMKQEDSFTIDSRALADTDKLNQTATFNNQSAPPINSSNINQKVKVESNEFIFSPDQPPMSFKESSDDETISPGFPNLSYVPPRSSKLDLNKHNINQRNRIPKSYISANEDETTATLSKTSRPKIRSSHNVIEQRYRNKINDKFTALQESVPTLRVVSRRKSTKLEDLDDMLDDHVSDTLPNRVHIHGSNTDGGERVQESDLSGADSDDLEGLEPARKLNKGTILTKSVEYIKFLEIKNSRMRAQQQELIEKARLLGIPLTDLDLESL